MQSFFLKILTQNCGHYVSIQLLQTLNILFENIKNETSICELQGRKSWGCEMACVLSLVFRWGLNGSQVCVCVCVRARTHLDVKFTCKECFCLSVSVYVYMCMCLCTMCVVCIYWCVCAVDCVWLNVYDAYTVFVCAFHTCLCLKEGEYKEWRHDSEDVSYSFTGSATSSLSAGTAAFILYSASVCWTMVAIVSPIVPLADMPLPLPPIIWESRGLNFLSLNNCLPQFLLLLPFDS